MINKIALQSVATFPDTTIVIERLKRINFFFGSNGTGKTTISKVIAKDESYPFCTLTWNNDLSLDRRVYNRDFFDHQFREELKGVYTLGEENIETKNRIKELKEEIDEIQKRINNYNTTLNGVAPLNIGKRTELLATENKYAEIFWAQKTKHYLKMKGAMEGYVGSKANFKQKIISETGNAAELRTQAELEVKCAKIFTNETPTEVEKIKVIDFANINSYEINSILAKKIVGKEDVNIADLIKKLENSDWVRQGKEYLKSSNDLCPFCQQRIPNNLSKELAEYFDEVFESDIKQIDELLTNYRTEADRILLELENIIASNSSYIDIEKLNTEKLLFDKITKLNIKKIQQKRRETSILIELELVKNVAENITKVIKIANNAIDENNKIAKNIVDERKKLTQEVWRFIVEEVNENIIAYKAEKKGIETAIKALEKSIADNEKNRDDKINKKHELEKKTTDILATCIGINNILSSYGFTGFKLETNKENNAYKIRRGDGSDAYSTLSEGEKNFVAFLYFYYYLKGNLSTNDIGNDMVVVIDDPVSSLDSDILFIVTTLIRDLIKNVEEFGHIKQLFILTHNIYFFKNVSYFDRGNPPANSSFYLVKKHNNKTFVEYHAEKNPIRGSYELLWQEIKSVKRNNATLQNTMRRIFEHYFNLVGGFDIDNLFKEFAGADKLICQSLISWLHDGSHTIADDYQNTTIDDEQVKKYLEIFKSIFIKLGHGNHYYLMMGEVPNRIPEFKKTGKEIFRENLEEAIAINDPFENAE